MPSFRAESGLPNAAIVALAAGRRLSSASRSALIFRNVERSIVTAETRLGRRTLLDAISLLPNGYQDDHVQYYRSIVRGRSWPHEERPSALPVFLDEYEQAALAFVRVGFEALDYLLRGTPAQLKHIYRRVEASEALRGQYGKRSQTGLDARLDRLERELGALLEKRLGADAIEALNLLGTPVDSQLTAEAALIEEFWAIRSLFPAMPSLETVLLGSAAAERLWTFLRRHARWSLAVLDRYYNWFEGPLFADQVQHCRARRREQAARRSALITELADSQPADWFDAVTERATALTLLNHLNLSLEPCFSFKGGIGLGQGFVFLLAEQAGVPPTTSPEELSAAKWRLLGGNNRPPRNHAMAS